MVWSQALIQSVKPQLDLFIHLKSSYALGLTHRTTAVSVTCVNMETSARINEPIRPAAGSFPAARWVTIHRHPVRK